MSETTSGTIDKALTAGWSRWCGWPSGAVCPKLMSLVGGMVAGADSIDDVDRLRHGAMGRLFSEVRAPSTLGSFLRSFTHGHVKQLHAVARRQQGAGYGCSKVKGLNALLGVVSTPLSVPVIAATRLRKGPSNSARGAAAFVAETIRTARACGASGLLVLRADSAFYGADVVNACRALGARFSITMRMNASVKATIARICPSSTGPDWIELGAETHRLFRRRRRQPHIVRGYFGGPHVRYIPRRTP